MSEEDRAAKAARAKALLKKRQQKKAAESATAATSPENASPVISPGTFSPPLSDPLEEDKRDLGDVFTVNAANNSDASWLTSLPRVASPPPPPAPPQAAHSAIRRVSASSPKASANLSSDNPSSFSPSDSSSSLQDKLNSLTKENERLAAIAEELRPFKLSAQQTEGLLDAERKLVEELRSKFQKLQQDTEIALENEHRTVSLLVSEKAHLTAELEQRENFESKAQELASQLAEERSKAERLATRVSTLEIELRESTQRAQLIEEKEKELLERYKEQERQLQITSAEAANSQKEASETLRKLRELEEQIQSDDRVERLENSLKNNQDRADELEFQLNKLKQSYASLKSEKETLESKAAENSKAEENWNKKTSALEAELELIRKELAGVKTERDSLSTEKSKLQELSDTYASTIKSHEEKLAQAAAMVAANAKQVQSTQHELKAAIRRADDSEKTQKSLQAEGTRLMQALEEMRPKIVELTATKLELGERVEALERKLQSRDAVISQLENDLGEARERNEVTEKTWKERLAEQERRHKEIQDGSTDIQKAYAELQEELDGALASLRNLESQRTNQHQEASRRMEEIDRLTSTLQTQGEELDAAKHELDVRRKEHDEEQDFLERAQNEVESLRAEISIRDEEIERLRETVNSPASSTAPRSLDDELLGSIRQQHAMELSAATSQIRALENTIFDKDSANHALQKQINRLEGELLNVQQHQHPHQRPNSRLGGQVPSRPSSRAMESDGRRSSLHSQRGGNVNVNINHHHHHPPPLSRSIFEHSMTPETLHKRKVSLSMLKARIESEAKATSSQPASRALSPVHSEGGPSSSSSSSRPASTTPHVHSGVVHRPQFLDESHVFWCHSCRGDLVIL